MNEIIVAFLVVACIIFYLIYHHFQQENALSEVQESTSAIVCLTIVYTILALTGIVLLTLSIVNRL